MTREEVIDQDRIEELEHQLEEAREEIRNLRDQLANRSSAVSLASSRSAKDSGVRAPGRNRSRASRSIGYAP